MASRTAQRLRTNQTEAEKFLWALLRNRQIDGRRFRRQAPIGPYIVDFICFETKLVVEVDGGQHAVRKEIDAERNRWLESQGFHVVRFWNNEVLENREGVTERIAIALRASPHPGPPPQGGRE